MAVNLFSSLNRLHLGMVGTALLSVAGIIACTLLKIPVPEALTAAATTSVGALAGITLPSTGQTPAPTAATAAPKEVTASAAPTSGPQG
jgi:hypothetical protein